jgi:uncharacterized protein (TIGR03663 family)
MLRDQLEAWRTRLAETDWIPWLIIALAAFLRFFLLGIKPPHFDEGINGWFVDQLVKNGFYRYDPTNYHGPLHFYILFLSQTLFGRNVWALRLPVVLVSIACVWLTLKYELFVGRNVSRMAALAMAVSPGFVFYGRYSIHEVWLVLFTMLFVLGLLGLWKFGTRNYLWCAGMGVTGMILTKETYVIHLGCAVIAIGVCYVSNLLSPVPNARLAKQTWDFVDLGVVICTGILLLVFFYSGTFFHWSGVKGIYQAYSAWFATGHEGHGHEKPWPYWLKLIAHYEWPVLVGLILCSLCQFFKNLSLRYLAIYGVGTLVAYSIVSYKTPWCIINIIWPFLFIFGGALLVIPLTYKAFAYVISAILLCVSLGQTIWLNYFRCTTDTEPYVYVQTYNDIYKLTRPLLKLARRNPIYYQLIGHIIRPSAYPLPWILGDFPHVGYYEHENLPAKLDADFLLVEEDRVADVESKLRDSYYTAPLRIRAYQDTSKLYLSARIFKDFFQGHPPDFNGAKRR